MSAHLDGLALATSRLHAYAESAGLDAPVPTARRWTVHRLVAHLGMVHRWAAGIVHQDEPRNAEEYEAEGLASGSPLIWLGRGSDRLLATLRRAPADLDVFFFLNDAPPPREAWARRQCHETTIHAVDGLAGQIGGLPLASDADIAADLAADGVDELLCGFATRKGENLRSSGRVEVDVRATDTGDVWRAVVTSGPLVVTRGTQAQDGDAILTGTAAQLYLGLWNRGNEIDCTGRDVVSLWRERMTVNWS